MSRIAYVTHEDVTGKAKEAYESLESQGKLTHMKKTLLQDYGTYEAFIGWYPSWNSLVEVVGLRAATIVAHAVSSTNGCVLCSLFFVSDIEALGEDVATIQFTEEEELLVELAKQAVKNPTAVSDELFAKLKARYTDREIVAIVGFMCQMMATNNFNSILDIALDDRLLPLQDKFQPADWRKDIK